MDPMLDRRRLLLGGLGALGGCAHTRPLDGLAGGVAGVVWQPDAATMDPYGAWHRLGARELLVQWMEARQPDGSRQATTAQWERLLREPWARQVILGLAGDVDERQARGDVPALVERSLELLRQGMPLQPAGWYFPVESDPSWAQAPGMAQWLAPLPRPLWISVYDNSNIGPADFAAWLAAWLPADVGVFFQDGVGLYTRSPPVALQYLQALRGRLGAGRVRLIAEVFRTEPGQGFRPAGTQELLEQLPHYRGEGAYLFDGPHYLPPAAVDALLAAGLERRLRGAGP